jgi:hypothetical protein
MSAHDRVRPVAIVHPYEATVRAPSLRVSQLSNHSRRYIQYQKKAENMLYQQETLFIRVSTYAAPPMYPLMGSGRPVTSGTTRIMHFCVLAVDDVMARAVYGHPRSYPDCAPCESYFAREGMLDNEVEHINTKYNVSPNLLSCLHPSRFVNVFIDMTLRQSDNNDASNDLMESPMNNFRIL